MRQARDHRRRRRLAQRLFLLLGAMMLAAPGLLTFFEPPVTISQLERRTLAEWPRRPGKLPQLLAWPRKIDAWLADHVGGRERLIGWMARLRFLLQEPGSTLVVFGTDDVLYIHVSGRMMLASGQPWLEAEQPDRLRQLLVGWDRMASEAGLPLLVVVVPDKETVRPESLPWWAKRFDTTARLDSLMAQIAKDLRWPPLDLRPRLMATGGRQIYFDLDTHWNAYGGYLAYEAIVQRLQSQWPALKPLAQTAITWGPGANQQELRRMLGLPEDPNSPPHAQPALVVPHAEVRQVDGKSYFRYISNPAADGPRILMLADSYGAAMQYWLGESVPQIVATRFGEPLGPLIARFPSDLVIIELVERNLGNPFILALRP